MSATLTRDSQSASTSIAAMETAMAGFERTTLADLLSQQEVLVKKSNEVAELGDAQIAAAKREIIEADMSALQKKIDAYREDTVELVAGLEAAFEQLGVELSALQKSAPEDLAIIAKAEEHLAAVAENGPKARQLLLDALETAKGKWIGRDAAVTEAERKLVAFDLQHPLDIAAAQSAIEEAKAEVERLRRKRIREAEFDGQFQRFIEIAGLIQRKLLDNVRQSEVRMTETQRILNEALTQKEQLATQLATLDTQIRAQEDVVMGLEQELRNAIDPAARSAVETRLGKASLQLADLTGSKQEAQVAFNAFEAAATKHQQMLASLQVQRDNQRSHARKLSIDSKARFSTAQNLVAIIQNTTQEDAAGKLHSVGSQLDRMALETAARALIASERARLEVLKNHEKDMMGFDQVGAAAAEGRATIAIEDAEIAARMRNNYGIDPLGASWLHIAEGMGQPDAANKTPAAA